MVLRNLRRGLEEAQCFSAGVRKKTNHHQELQLLQQGEQNWVGNSALRDLYSTVCVASGQLSSESVRSHGYLCMLYLLWADFSGELRHPASVEISEFYS